MNRGVAQFGGALCSGRRGRWFESSHLDEIKVMYEFLFVSINEHKCSHLITKTYYSSL